MEQRQEEPQLKPDIGTIDEILYNYIEMERSMVSQLFFKYTKHGTSIGGFREDIWRELFVQILPKKFVVEQSVFIIDSEGHVSPEVDLVILDEIYTPYIFRKGRLKFIPIEAVAVAIECKSLSASYKALDNWTRIIKDLKTSRESVARMHGYIATGAMDGRPQTQTSTRPILIYCCLDGKHTSNMELFDFSLQADSEQCKIHIHRNKETNLLNDWYHALNHSNPDVKEKIYDAEKELSGLIDDYRVMTSNGGELQEVSLLSFNFQLNQLLMLINNPMLFPHMAYVNLFNKKHIQNDKEDV